MGRSKTFPTSMELPSSSRLDCPPLPDEVADAYVLGRLEPLAAERFEQHYFSCPGCANLTRAAMAFIKAFREAAKHSHFDGVSARPRQIH